MTKKESAGINDLREDAAIIEIESAIRAVEKNITLYEEINFDKRIDHIDFIEFQVIDRIEALLQETTQQDHLILLKFRAGKVKAKLKEIDANLFQKLRAKFRTGKYTGQAFKDLINRYVDFSLDDSQWQAVPGYDNLDLFINALFPSLIMPGQTKDLEPEMVYYQKTPARMVFELVERGFVVKEDIFFDIGSGLGQVVILVNLLTGITTKGIEFEPAFCDYATECAAELLLSNVTFINADARKADYTEGTIFFMFTPFSGKMLQDVLAVLRQESLKRKIKIITYGPCTTQVAAQSWLDFAIPATDNIYSLAVFTSS